MNNFEPYEIDGIAQMRKSKPKEFAIYSDNFLRAAYSRYCETTISAHWLEVTPQSIENFFTWGFTTNFDLIRKEMRQRELTRTRY